MIKWNWFDTDCKNEWAIFTRLISLTGPLDQRNEEKNNICMNQSKQFNHNNLIYINQLKAIIIIIHDD